MFGAQTRVIRHFHHCSLCAFSFVACTNHNNNTTKISRYTVPHYHIISICKSLLDDQMEGC